MIKLDDQQIARLRKGLEQCENYTSGIGSCYENGCEEHAEFSSEAVCWPCLINRILLESAEPDLPPGDKALPFLQELLGTVPPKLHNRLDDLRRIVVEEVVERGGAVLKPVHARRVTELLEANNREVEARRKYFRLWQAGLEAGSTLALQLQEARSELAATKRKLELKERVETALLEANEKLRGEKS